MSTPGDDVRPRSRWVLAVVILVAAAGIAVGWWMPPGRERSFDHVYALLAPTLIATVCVQALLKSGQRHRWRVPLLLGVAIVNIATRPHVPVLSALSISGAAVATLASLRDRKPAAILATLVSCLALGASLVAGLARS